MGELNNTEIFDREERESEPTKLWDMVESPIGDMIMVAVLIGIVSLIIFGTKVTIQS